MKPKGRGRGKIPALMGLFVLRPLPFGVTLSPAGGALYSLPRKGKHYIKRSYTRTVNRQFLIKTKHHIKRSF
ncbi:MAG: hypothetical protein HDT48_08335 [Ruminococcaceae bacterium]|nr:hypothetical protein [Oscillospiraceae bacterium]